MPEKVRKINLGKLRDICKKNGQNSEYTSLLPVNNGIIRFQQKPNKRGDHIMSQKNLPFKYEQEKKEKNLTALCGLLLYLG